MVELKRLVKGKWPYQYDKYVLNGAVDLFAKAGHSCLLWQAAAKKRVQKNMPMK